MKILVTGASGFIGSFIVEEGLERGHEMWAGMRPTSSHRYLDESAVSFVNLDLAHPDILRRQLAECKEQFGGWDVIVHAAGATKCIDKRDFFRVNTDGTRHIVEALRDLEMVPRRFVFISSLGVYGAIKEKPVRRPTSSQPWVYEPICEEDVPAPNTAYGASKLAAERFLRGVENFPYVILRPTGVYGPREKDYFMMAQSISRHVDFTVGFRPQEITFVYVKDLVNAVFLAMEKPVVGKSYFISDGQVYHSTAFSDLIAAELGHPFFVRIKAPVWLLRGICAVSGTFSAWFKHPSTLNNDKFHILRQRNWQCDIEPARRELGYKPCYLLPQGVKETIAWYKKEGWL